VIEAPHVLTVALPPCWPRDHSTVDTAQEEICIVIYVVVKHIRVVFEIHISFV
jgi:hypothetical protein